MNNPYPQQSIVDKAKPVKKEGLTDAQKKAAAPGAAGFKKALAKGKAKAAAAKK